MANTSTAAATDWLRLPEVRWLSALVVFEALAVVGYFALSSASVTSVRYVLYPFVWINVGVVAVVATTTPAASRRTKLLAGGVSLAYFLALAGLSGLVGLELGAHTHSHVHGLQFTMSTPGWGPRIGYAGSLLTATFVPFRVVGYLALSYLVYATVLDAAGAALSGVLGFASCLSCGLPIVGSLAAGAIGAMGGAAVAAYSIDISTAVFVVAVGLLTLRPGFDP
jgi:hypothetical protein